MYNACIVNKNIVIIAAVIAFIVLGGGAYMMLNRSAVKPLDSSNQKSVTPASSSKSGIKSLRDFASLGSNQECTFSDSESENKGTMYIGNGDVRGDFESNLGGKKVISHMIQDENGMFIWTDGEKQGFKVSLESMDELAGKVDTTGFDLNKEVDYSCKPWSVVSSFFDAPKEIEFQDYSKLMEGVGEMMKVDTTPGATGSSSCSVCDNLPVDSQASCRTALKCN